VYHHPKLLLLDKTLVYVSGLKLKNNEYLILVSYNKQHQSLLNYKERWQIETMFKGFKTKGFHLEDTHLRDIHRIDKLVAVVSIAFAWAYKVGIYLHEQLKPIVIKKHQRKAYSFFTYGLRFITQALFSHPNHLLSCINVLSCT
jgi:hypothetical protein